MKCILVIEDDDSQRELFKTVLEKNGYNVRIAEDGMTGGKLLRQHRFDMVITDIYMPERDGLEVVKELRQELNDIKILAISGGGRLGAGSPASALRAASLFGADEVLAKPIEIKELLAIIAKLIPNGMN